VRATIGGSGHARANEQWGPLMSSEIFLICADEISREGLTHILQSAGFRIRGSFERLNSVPPVEMSDALLLIDCPSPLDQADAVHIARNRFPTAKVILLSKSFEPSSMIECFNQGAAGYIVKSATSSRLVASLRLAAVGEKVIPSHFVDLLRDRGPGYSIMNRGESAIEKANLTPRELDVLCCLWRVIRTRSSPADLPFAKPP